MRCQPRQDHRRVGRRDELKAREGVAQRGDELHLPTWVKVEVELVHLRGRDHRARIERDLTDEVGDPGDGRLVACGEPHRGDLHLLRVAEAQQETLGFDEVTRSACTAGVAQFDVLDAQGTMPWKYARQLFRADEYVTQGAGVVVAEVVEVERKPSMPIGDRGQDAFGATPECYLGGGLAVGRAIEVGR